MANQERVVLVAEVRDEATRPLEDIQKTVDNTERKVDGSSRKMTNAFERFDRGGSNAFQRFSGNMRGHLGRGMDALGDLGKRIHDSDGMFGRFVRGGTRGLQNFAAGFKDPMAAASSFTGKLGSIGGVVSKGVGALGGIGGALSPAVSAAGNVISGIGNIAGKAASAGAAILSNIGSALADGAKKAGAIAGILGGLVIAEGLRGGLSRAMNIEDAEARMRGMGYAADDIGELMDNASDAIMGTAYRLDDAATAAAQFSASGIDAGEDMERVIGLVGDSAFAAGTDFNDMGEIWAQVAARGRLDGQTMNRLLAAGVGITSELAEHFGVADEEVQKLVSDGQISFEDFAEVMEVKVGGAAQEMAETTRGALMNVQAGLHMVGAEVAGPFMQIFRGTFNRLQEPLFAFAEVVTPVFEVLTERAEEWASGMYSAGEDAAEGIRQFVKPMEQVADLMRDGTPMIQAFTEVFDIDTDSGILGFLTEAASVVTDLSPLTGILRGIADAGSELGSALWDAVKDIFSTLAELAPIVGEAFMTLGSLLAPLLADLLAGIAGVLPMVVAFTGELLTALLPVLPLIADALTSVLNAVLPLLPVFADLAINLISALAPVLPVLVGALVSLLDAVLPLLPVLVELAVLVLEPLIGVVGWLAEILVDVLAWTIETIVVPVVEFLAEHLGTLIDWLVGLGDESTDQGAFVAAAFEWIGETASWLWNDILAPFFSWASEAWSGLGETFTGIYEDYIAPVFTWFGDAATWLKEEIWDPLVSGVTSGWTSLGEKLDEIYWTYIEPVFGWITDLATFLFRDVLLWYFNLSGAEFQSLGEVFSMVWHEWISPVLSWFGDAGVALYENYLGPAFGWIGDRWDWLAGVFSSIWEDGIRPILSAFGEFFTETIPGWVDTGVGLIRDAWESVKQAFAAPIDAVIDFVWNRGIAGAFNAAAETVGISTQMPTVDPIGAFADGGLAPAGWALVGEEGPELVNFSQPGRVYTTSETSAAISGIATGGAPAGIGGDEREGGNWFTNTARSVGDGIAAGAGWVGDRVMDGVNWVRGKLADTAEAVLNPILDDLKGRVSGDGRMGEMASGLASSGVDMVLDWMRGQDDDFNASGEIIGGKFTANPGGFNQPAQGVITSRAGARAYAGRFGGMHFGVDIANAVGSTVRAAYDGIVRKVYGSGMDQRMVLGHKGFDTSYLHNSAHLVSVGDTVTGGQPIARMGTAGTGPHLHFEVHPGGWYNPSIQGVNALFDQGGVLPTGPTLAMNRTGLPEYVLTNRRFGQVEDLLDFVIPRIPDSPAELTESEEAAPVLAGATSGGSITTIDRRVTVAEGAVQISVEAGNDGYLSEEGLEQLKEAIEEIFEESERRDY